MSVKIMRMVWDLEMGQKEKLVLLAYADFADHDGGSIHPAVVTIAKRTGYSERSIQRHTRVLEKHGWLISDGYGVGQGNTNRWHMPLMDGVLVSPFAEINADTDMSFLETEKVTPVEQERVSSVQERVTPVAQEKVTFVQERVSSVQERMTSVHERVTPMTLKGDIAVSSEPSLTVIKPSTNARAFASQKIKMLSQKAQRGETAELQRARSPNAWLSDHEPPPSAAGGDLALPPHFPELFLFSSAEQITHSLPLPCLLRVRPPQYFLGSGLGLRVRNVLQRDRPSTVQHENVQRDTWNVAPSPDYSRLVA